MNTLPGKSLRVLRSLFCLAALSCLPLLGLSGQARFALLIGNSDYKEISQLKNPVNDATDMAKMLKTMGFEVQLLTNARLDEMDAAVVKLGNRLSVSSSSVGFFYYAGHGIQSAGQNYLVPVDANLPGESFLRNRALSAQNVLDTLQSAGNTLNIIILDACRDNPFGWSRSSSRGLTNVGSQPPGSIIVYATSAGSVAQDGEGKNGVFTEKLMKELEKPGVEIGSVFKRTGVAVQEATGGKQIPAIYSQYFLDFVLKPAPAAVETPRTGATPPPAKVASLDRTDAQPVRLILDWMETGYRVSLNGVEVPAARMTGKQLVLDLPGPGVCKIQVTIPGLGTWEQGFELGEGESRTLTRPLDFLKTAWQSRLEKINADLRLARGVTDAGTVGMIVGGAGLVLAGVAALVGVDVNARYDQSSDPAVILDLGNQLDVWNTCFLAGLSAGGAGIGGGILAFILAPDMTSLEKELQTAHTMIDQLAPEAQP